MGGDCWKCAFKCIMNFVSGLNLTSCVMRIIKKIKGIKKRISPFRTRAEPVFSLVHT